MGLFSSSSRSTTTNLTENTDAKATAYEGGVAAGGASTINFNTDDAVEAGADLIASIAEENTRAFTEQLGAQSRSEDRIVSAFDKLITSSAAQTRDLFNFAGRASDNTESLATRYLAGSIDATESNTDKIIDFATAAAIAGGVGFIGYKFITRRAA